MQRIISKDRPKGLSSDYKVKCPHCNETIDLAVTVMKALVAVSVVLDVDAGEVEKPTLGHPTFHPRTVV